MQHSPLQLRQKLIDTVDGNYHVKDMDAIVEVLGILERLPVTKDMLESTRLGKTVNEFRRRVNNDYLAKRAKALVKKWRETILLPEDSSQSSQPVQQQQQQQPVVLPPQPPPKTHNGTAGNSVDALLREQIAQAQREGHGRTTDEIVKDLEKKSVEQKWEAAAKSSTSGNSKRRKTAMAVAPAVSGGESKSSRKSKSAASSVEVSQDSDMAKMENDIVETYLRSQNELRLQMERQYRDSLTNDNANSYGAGSFNDADENDNENHPSFLLNQSKFSKRYSPKKTKKLKSTSIETASSSSSSAISPPAFQFSKTQLKQPSVSPTLPTYSRHESSSEDSHLSASKQESSNRRKRKLSSPSNVVVSPVEEEDEDESFEEVEPFFTLDSNPRKSEDGNLVVEFSSSSRQFNDVTEDRLSSSSSSSNSSNSNSNKNNIRGVILNNNGSVSSTLASLEYGQSTYSPTTKSNFSQFRNEQKLSPTIGSSHWNSHHTSPSLSTSATSSATKRKKSKTKRDKSTELNHCEDPSSDSHSVVVPEGGSGLTTFDLIEDAEEEQSAKVLDGRASSSSLDNNKKTFLFDEESRMDVVSPSGSVIHGADFSVEDPKFSYRAPSLQLDTDDYNDNVDIIRREIDVESLHSQQIPNVNGNMDTEGKFHKWHETYSVQSLGGEPLHILPYAVIDF